MPVMQHTLEMHFAIDTKTRLVVGGQMDIAGVLLQHFLKVLIYSFHIGIP